MRISRAVASTLAALALAASFAADPAGTKVVQTPASAATGMDI
jgi:hypothetical protein